MDYVFYIKVLFQSYLKISRSFQGLSCWFSFLFYCILFVELESNKKKKKSFKAIFIPV